MFKPVPKALNSQNLLEISTLLNNLEHFIFFGTLLGITREGDIIPGDDDIDIYVETSERSRLIDLLKDNGYIFDEKEAPNLTKNFLQLKIIRNDISTYVDFYFYDKSHKNFISEKWNFTGKVDDPSNEMHIPKELIYPLQKFKYQNIWLSIPAKPEEVCHYLYGKNWRFPLKKRTQYYTTIFGNKPITLYGYSGWIIFVLIKLFHVFRNLIRIIFSLNKS